MAVGDDVFQAVFFGSMLAAKPLKATVGFQNLGSSAMKKSHAIALIIAFLLMVAIYTQITIFVVQPIGALPEGGTVIITRLNKTEFIDSPDGMCERLQGGVSLFCRAMIMAAVMKAATILLRLPYSPWLYEISTGGKTYDR